MTNPLIGKHLFIGAPDWHSSGEIIDMIEPGHYLIKIFRGCDSPQYLLRVVHIENMVADKQFNPDVIEWFFFDTKGDLDAFHNSLDVPSREEEEESNVLHFTKNETLQ